MHSSPPIPPASDLVEMLARIDGRGYKAYRDIEGAWQFSEFILFIDRVQSDPFASPSKLRVRVDLDLARLPANALENRIRRIACASWFARAFRSAVQSIRPPRSGTGKGGQMTIDAGGPEVLERTAVVFGEDYIEARFELGLPANGRRVLGHAASILIIDLLPRVIASGWIDRREADEINLTRFINCVENQETIRRQLADRGLVAFVGDGSILPREGGASENPLPREQVLPFQSPESFAVEFEVPHANAGSEGRVWRGMGIPRGVVLLVGGGYHGKSTLLRAIERGIAPHVPGDGREQVVTDPTLVKIRAEDGRSVCGVGLQGFIDHLPPAPGETQPRSTEAFSTTDASGSTSQAANIVEAIEAGATGLLLDEDTSATNFMVRDAQMQALIHPKDEPITPFLDRIRELFDVYGISTLLVMGSSGDYFEVADAIIEMRAYQPVDVTASAKEIARSHLSATNHSKSLRARLRAPTNRIPDPQSFDARRGRRELKISSRGCEEILYGATEIDLRSVEQLFDASQTRAIGAAIHLAMSGGLAENAGQNTGPPRSLSELLDDIDQFFDKAGLDPLDPFHRKDQHPGAFARPRRFEIAAAINRMRTLRLISSD